MTETIYNAQYFIDKFEKIPEDKWCTKYFQEDDKHCVLGHCGVKNTAILTEEANKLIDLFFNHKIYITHVNDGLINEYNDPTPKQRILHALKDILEKTVSENVSEKSLT